MLFFCADLSTAMNTYKIPRRFGHFVFGFIQSGVTCAVAAGVSSLSESASETIIINWIKYWLLSWATMIPIILLAAPFIRSAVDRLTNDQTIKDR